jgi:hypothetical protein
MILRPKIWLVCESCGEFFTKEQIKEGEICSDCNKGKLKLFCAECGEFVEDCNCKIENTKTIVQKLDSLSAEIKKLDSLASQVKELEFIYKQKIKDLEEFKKSMLQKAFSGELTKV